MSMTKETSADALESQNPQRPSQNDKNTRLLTNKRPIESTPSEPASVVIQNNLSAPDPKKRKLKTETSGSSIAGGNDNDMKNEDWCGEERIDNVSPNDKAWNETTSTTKQSNDADSGKETLDVSTLTMSLSNVSQHNKEDTKEEKCNISKAKVRDDSFPVRNPPYTEENARRESFRDWPIENQNIASLVDAGFFYTGEEDIVRCFHCDIGLAEWSPDDDPWHDHARHSPNCPYLKDRKTDGFIADIQAKWSEIYTPRHQQYTDVTSRYDTFDSSWTMNNVTQSPEDLASAGFFYTGTEDKVCCHYCGGILIEWEPDDDPWLEHVRWFPLCKFVLVTKGLEFVQSATQNASYEEDDFEEEMMFPPSKAIAPHAIRSNDYWNWVHDTEPDQLGELGTIEDTSDVGNKNDEHGNSNETSSGHSEETWDSDQSSSNETSSGHREETWDSGQMFKTLRQENERLKEKIQCKICLKEEIWLIFIPCGHLVACIECGEKASICAVCNVIIQTKSKVRLL